MTRDQFDSKLRKILFTEELKPYIKNDILYNGLQTWGKKNIKTVGFGVSASIRLFEIAKKNHCDAIVVHHGISTQEHALARLSYERYAWLIKNDISLWSSHFFLDAHPVVGHAACILKTIEAKLKEPYMIENAPWGWVGEYKNATSLQNIIEIVKPYFSPETVIYNFGPTKIKRVVCATGAGAPYISELSQLMEQKIDLFITGEAREWNREEFREAGISLIAGGHYHTEMFGVKKLQQIVEKKWSLKTVWLDLPNNI